MVNQIWTAINFLSGSTSKKIPYEIVHCLSVILEDWSRKKAIITTALIQEKNFYFHGVQPDFYNLAHAYTEVNFKNELVQIALPQIYQHRPLLNVALYHELGHYVDITHGIVRLSNFLIPMESIPLPGIDRFGEINPDYKNLILNNHLKEYFADIFATSYVGKAYKEFLIEFAGDYPVSETHPATVDRLTQIDSFLLNQHSIIIELFQASLNQLKLPKLEISFDVPDISDSFNNVRPYSIKNERELHGIIVAGTDYLKNALKVPFSPWTEEGEAGTERIINNLIEKSIRNKMIVNYWGSNETTV